LNFKWIISLCALAGPALAQYAGPAILSRGDTPTAMNNAQVSFRPYFEFNGIYDSGLAGPGVTQQGQLGTTGAAGIQLAGGISGSHSWRRTSIGVDYHGNINHYFHKTFYDATDQFLALGIKHQFSRHVALNVRAMGGLFDQSFNLGALESTVPYDPSQTTLPTTNFFDNRTEYLNTQADVIYQRTARLSFDFGGGAYVNRMRSASLYGVTGENAKADMQYRVSRRATIGLNYIFDHFTFTRIYGNTEVQSVAGTFAMRFTRSLEFTGYGGVSHINSQFTQVVPIDPAIAALLGVTEAQEVTFNRHYTPLVNGRLSYVVHNGVYYLSVGHVVTPGNGLFLTSEQTTGAAGYNYTGLRHWSMGASVAYNRAHSFGNIVGNYGNVSGTLNLSRQLAHNFHAIMSFSGNRYISNNFNNYNRVIYQTRIGIGWSPGDIPLRVW
jgi:hypothetical protein